MVESSRTGIRTRPIDRIDRRILELLQQDGRLSNVELARRVSLTPTPCLERVRRLEREGYIRGYAARLSPERLGLGLVVYIQVRLDQTDVVMLERFKHAVVDMQEVQECHMIAGGFDYLLKIRVADIGEFRRFMGQQLSALPGVIQTHSQVVIEEIKSTRALPITQM